MVENESRLLEEAGHKVFLYTRHNSELDSMSVYKKLMLPLSFIYSGRTKADITDLIKEKSIDVVMVHNTLMFISPSVYYAALKCGVPVIQVVHNFRLLCPGAALYRNGHICEECIENGLHRALRYSCYRDSRIFTLACVLSMICHRRLRIYEKLYYICLTEFGRSKLLSYPGIKKERVFVKPNFTGPPKEIIPYEQRENCAVYAGRLDELKGIREIFYAFRDMGEKAPLLYVCGSGPLEEWCGEFIRENSLSGIRLLGRIEHEEVIRLMGRARVVLCPSKWYEGLPMNIIEAFSVGTPVIGSSIGNVAAVITSEGLGRRIDISRGSQAVKAAVLSFFYGPGSYEYDEQAFKEARERYGRNNNRVMLEKILEAVVDNG